MRLEQISIFLENKEGRLADVTFSGPKRCTTCKATPRVRHCCPFELDGGVRAGLS